MKFAVAAPRKSALPKRKAFGLLGATLCALLGLSLSAQAATFTVTSNADSGVGTLRQAINDANNTVGADTIAFNLGSFTIAPVLAFPTITEAVTIDGTTEPGYAGTPIVVLDGSGAGAAADGLAIRASNCVIKGLTIQNYSGNGISIAGAAVTGCTVSSCRIGTNSAGTVAAANNNGIAIFNGAKNNIIGGTTAAAMNVISGNTTNGVLIFGAGTDNNSVQGNRIGTSADGTTKVGNATGVIIFQGAQSNHIGLASGSGNLISGNSASGVQIFNTGTNGNTVERNLIGTNAAATAALGNGGNGVQVFDSAQNNIVGGTVANAGNLVSGNATNGVLINNAGTTGNKVQGNHVGTNAAGTAAIGNGNAGVQIQTGATANTIGGTDALTRNVISGNVSSGIKILDAGTNANIVTGNRIGTNDAATAALANGSNGVEIFSGAQSNIVGGGAAGAGNILSGNTASGIQIFGAGTNSNQVSGNLIGTNAAGTAAIANGTVVTPKEGVYITGGAQNNIVGGTATGAGNLISGNTGNGISISGSGTTGNRVLGNRIGTDAAGTSALANSLRGVEVRSSATGNNIGLLPAVQSNGGTIAEGNVIAFNTLEGVRVAATSNDNAIRGNRVSQNGNLGIDLVGGTEDANHVTSNDAGDADTGANLQQNYPTLTAASLAGSTVSISGTINSAASTTFLIDYYGNTAADPSGAGEGQTYLGSSSVTTNASGNANLSFSNSVTGSPAFITATATDPAGNTSEFSLARAVTVVATYTIGGRLTNSNGGAGIANVSVALSGNITDAVTTNGNGDYVFSGLTPGNYTVTPSASAGYSFTPTSRNVSITNANVTGQNFTGVASGVRVIGRISDSSGTAIAGVSVTRTGSATPVTTNSAGYYTFTGVAPGTYTVTPSKAGYTFTPASRSVNVAGTDVTNQNFIGRNGPPPPTTYQIVGRVYNSSGTAIPGVSVTRTGSATAAISNSAGYYTLTGVPAGTYTVTPSKAGYSFAPVSRSVTVTNANVVNQNFIGTNGPPPAPTYHIFGRVYTSNGTGVPGVSVTRTGSATPVVTNSAGYYQFNGVPNGTYTVTPSLSGRTFTPASRTATVNGADTANNNFIASN